ncbi:MAG: ADP-forming succinate--CoA ligase subunit beta [Nitrososphaerota archaeon]
MKLYEYEAAETFMRKNIPYPDYKVVKSPEEAKIAAKALGPPVVLKAQVLVGGRGKVGGIRIVESLEDVEKTANEILGMTIKGEKVNKLIVAKAVRPIIELYTALVLDRSREQHLLLASKTGGINIEELFSINPDILCKIPIDPIVGLHEYQVRKAVSFLELKNQLAQECSKIIKNLYELYVELGCELVEINPLAVTAESKLMALDAKMVIDDNAVRKYRLDFSREEATLEEKARALGINYVELDGDIGIISNGAGLTMATMDLVKNLGGQPANFLDIGGGASEEVVFNALSLLLQNEKIKIIFINVLGGLTRCDEVANGIVRALKSSNKAKRIVVRLVGNREELGRRILMENGLEWYDSMEEAARKVVELSLT